MATPSLTSRATPSFRRQLHALDIDDLAEILDLLRRHGYSGTSYYDLGLHLGLASRTLDVIKEDNKGDVNSRLTECLKAWLQQANDVHVTSVGPTYHSLIQALRKLEENAIADGIDREKHPACAIFTQWESNECIAEALPRLVLPLYKEKIIDEMLLPTTGEVHVLLEAVKKSICFDYHNLEKLANILMKLKAQSVTSVAVSMLEDYRNDFPEDYVTIISKLHISISLPLKLTPEFTKIRIMFTNLIDDVAQAMKNSVRYENLKRYVGHIETLRPHLTHCENINEIIELIGDHCSLINVALLEGVVKKLKVKKAESAIQKYKNEIENFHEEGRPLRQFLDQYLAPASPLQCETATIFIRKEVKDCDVKDINILMIVAFETLAPNIQVHVIKEDNSFTITCSFPVLLSEALIATALDNIDSLIERGVTKLTIGYCTVYDHEKIFKYDEFQHGEAATLKKYALTSEMKQQLYASVYSSQGTMEQLLISRTIQLLPTSEVEPANIQQLKDEKEKLEAEVKIMNLDVSHLRTREKEERRYRISPPNVPDSSCRYSLVICILFAILAILAFIFLDSQDKLANCQNEKKTRIEELGRKHEIQISKLEGELAAVQIRKDKDISKLELVLRAHNYEICKQKKDECIYEKEKLRKDIVHLSEQKAALDLKYTRCDSERPGYFKKIRNLHNLIDKLKSDIAALDEKYVENRH